MDSEGFTRTHSISRETTPSKEKEGAQPQQTDKKNQSKMKTQDEIKEMIARAMQTSMALKEVDPSTMLELRELNQKFLTQGQIDQIWIIEQREKLLKGSNELESLIQKENNLRIKKRL